MFVFLISFLLIFSIVIISVKRSQETLYVFSTCISLAVFLFGIGMYIAKKGGVPESLLNFFYINSEIKKYFQYFLISLDSLGYIIALGKMLFPLFVLLLSLNLSNVFGSSKRNWKYLFLFIFPIISLAFYYPPVYDMYSNYSSIMRTVTNTWIICYILASCFLLIYELYSIQIRFIRKQFISIVLFILSLSFIYLLYFGQTPDEVYSFYNSTNGIYYIKSTLSVTTYLLIVAINIILSIMGFFGLIRYTGSIFIRDKDEIIIQKKTKSISTGTTIFVHSFKNQFLANRVLHKKLKREIEERPDLKNINLYANQLYERNEKLLERIDELYRSVKTNHINLENTEVEKVFHKALNSFYEKYPERKVFVQLTNHRILADDVRLSEVIYNLLINAQEAIDTMTEKSRQKIFLYCYNTKKYTVIEVTDTGPGMKKEDMKKIFNPFYSIKNNNYNWGMGLHYVRKIVKEHFGIVRCESNLNQGTTFLILLPKLN